MLLMNEVLQRSRVVAAFTQDQIQEYALDMLAGLANASGAEIPDWMAAKLFEEMMKTTKPSARRAIHSLENAARFVVDPTACVMLEDLIGRQAKRLVVSASHLFAPAEDTWIEATTATFGKVGVLLQCADDTLQHGRAGLFLPQSGDYAQWNVGWDLRTREIVRPFGGDYEAARLMAAAGNPTGDASADLRQIGQFILAVLSMLCTPRIYVKREVEFGRLNRQRAAKGHWPLLAYHEVKIDLSGAPITLTNETGKGAPRALHFVRAYLRVRRNGQIEFVRPHWRGDAQLGVKKPAYRIAA